MRTTINIDDALLRRARELAARTRRSLGDVVDDALRMLLTPRDETGPDPSVELPVYGGSGLRPGVDLEDREGLAALLDEEAGTGAAR
jgi:Bacterial antitoxin of type II TA system, VapB